jgi:DUF4097 and DUF4098 domain-containing protein YvlB
MGILTHEPFHSHIKSLTRTGTVENLSNSSRELATVSSLATTSPTPSLGSTPPRRSPLSSTLLIIAIIVVGGLLITLVVTSTLSVTTKPIAAYSTPVSESETNPSSLEVSNVNGAVTLGSWSGSNLMVNGTVTARGLSASTDAITFIESNTAGHIVFQAVFPTTGIGVFFLPSYTVDIQVYVPQSTSLGSVQLTTTNGNVLLSNLNATSIEITSTNGSVQASAITTRSLSLGTTNGGATFTCASCGSVSATSTNGAINGNLPTLSQTGSYDLRTTNGSVALTLPASSSFKLTATTVNGGISTSGLGLSAQAGHSLSFGTGTATVTLATTSGSITITGT